MKRATSKPQPFGTRHGLYTKCRKICFSTWYHYHYAIQPPDADYRVECSHGFSVQPKTIWGSDIDGLKVIKKRHDEFLELKNGSL